MNTRSLMFYALVAGMACAAAHAGQGTGVVANVVVRDSDGLTYVTLSTAPTGRPACAVNTAYWMIPNENSETGKKMYALLLSAQLAGRTVEIVGKNTCVRWGDGEDILYVNLLP